MIACFTHFEAKKSLDERPLKRIADRATGRSYVPVIICTPFRYSAYPADEYASANFPLVDDTDEYAEKVEAADEATKNPQLPAAERVSTMRSVLLLLSIRYPSFH